MNEEHRSFAVDLIDDEIESLKIAKAHVRTEKKDEGISKLLPWYLRPEFERETAPKEED